VSRVGIGNHLTQLRDGSPFVMALAGGRSELIEPFDLFGAQLDSIGGGHSSAARVPTLHQPGVRRYR
jgi:hypothetical protein